MDGIKYTKLLYIVAFVAFASVSCWATTESIHMLLPSWPTIMCWVVSIGFFIIASYGTKMIVDSLNQNVYVEKRGAKLLSGMLLLLIFWLVCSMPTNTHTFFYRTCITDVLTNDLSTTKSYLVMLKNNVKSEALIKQKQKELENRVYPKIVDLEHEIDNPINPGNGPETKKILGEITQILECSPISALSGLANTPSQKRQVKDEYRKKIISQLENKKMLIRENLKNGNEISYKAIAKKQIKDIEAIEDPVRQMAASGDVDNYLVIQASSAVLMPSYATLKTYKDYVSFNSDADEKLYTADNIVTRTSRMLSVIDVWKDFLAGKHAGRGFIFWVIISILVDVAAFIFFDIAFKKTDY
ncbi:MAG: hypothetical protein IKR18_05475 [Bacteroidaceae bacterium]|nr:hypothetical protein [Bacteroidaceae bacterium]